MAFIETPNTCVAAFLVLGGPDTQVNTLWFEGTGPFTPADLDGLGILLVDWWHDEIAPFMADDFYLSGIRLTAQDSESAPSLIVTAADSGLVASPPLPNNVSATVTFRTALRGRSFRGRNYVIGLCEDQVSGNIVNNSVVLGYLDAYDKINGLIVGEPLVPVHVVCSHFALNAARPVGVTTPVTSYDMDAFIKTQRRRAR